MDLSIQWERVTQTKLRFQRVEVILVERVRPVAASSL
jgi:hypothetical protein